MTNKEITALALKVFAIYVLVQTLLAVPVIVQAISSNFYDKEGVTAYAAIGVGIVAITILFGVAIAIWKLSNGIIIKTTSSPLNKAVTPNTTEEFILSALGIYLAFKGLLSVFYMSVSAYTQLYGQQTSQEVSPQTAALLISNVIQVIVGLTLILRARGWVMLLRKFRGAGLETKPSNN